jgi:hypothetical protein
MRASARSLLSRCLYAIRIGLSFCLYIFSSWKGESLGFIWLYFITVYESEKAIEMDEFGAFTYLKTKLADHFFFPVWSAHVYFAVSFLRSVTSMALQRKISVGACGRVIDFRMRMRARVSFLLVRMERSFICHSVSSTIAGCSASRVCSFSLKNASCLSQSEE